jgi:hypothetical protein
MASTAVKTAANQQQSINNPATKSAAPAAVTAASSAAPPTSAAVATMSLSASSSSTAHPKAAKLVPFLRKVQILCETAPSEIARWSADGKQFDVLDPKGFDDLLKVHFEGAAPATFHRQLFFYGWVKLNHSNGGGDERTKGTWSFRHPSFLRDEPSRIYEIKRYARASDREEQEDGSRVDILERRVSALQSLVDDLSRKLAAVQLTLDRAPLPVVAGAAAVEKPGRKRVKDEDVNMDEDFMMMNDELRLSEDDIMNLFEGEPFLAEEEAPPTSIAVVTTAPPTVPAMVKPKIVAPPPQQLAQSATTKQQAHNFLSAVMSTPQFQKAITSVTTTTSVQSEKPKNKVESIPHLSVC